MCGACRIKCIILPLLVDPVDVDVRNKFSQRQGGPLYLLSRFCWLSKIRSDDGVCLNLCRLAASSFVRFCVID